MNIMTTGLLLFILILICCARGIEIKTKELGTLIGSTARTAWTLKTIYQFLGIKYGLAPSGSRRFKLPILAVPWEGIHNVQEYGKPCPAIKNMLNMTKKELGEDLEDCLHLSIYSKSISGKQPVMFFIYGGAFEDGSSSQYPPNYLLEEDIVLVVPQYRIGPFGFLSTQTDEIPGNVAMHDIILALSWTQSFIHYFGGDPTRITVFGHSAGAAILSALVFSPTVPNGLFHRAIIQSGSMLSTTAFDFNPVRNARDIAKIGCNNTITIEDVNQCFMKLNVLSLLQAYHKHAWESKNNGGLTEYGGAKLTYSDLLPLPPYDLIGRKTVIKNIPLIAGVTKHDGTYILAMLLQYLIENFGLHFDELNKSYSLDTIIEYLGLKDYTGTLSGFVASTLLAPGDIMNGNLTNVIDGLVDLCGVITMKAPILRLIQSQAKYYSNQTYLYTFDYKGEFSNLENNTIFGNYDGVHHFSDILYLFPFTEFGNRLNRDDRKIAKKMVKLWTSFAATGVPTINGESMWPPVTEFIGPYLHIDKTNKIGQNFLDEYSVAAREAKKNHCSKTQLSFVVLLSVLIFAAFKLF